MSDDIRPFRIDIPDADLDDLRDRLRRTRWPEPEPVGDWSQGMPLAYTRELCDYWLNDYDWRAAERRLNGFPQFRTEIDGLGIHFLHVRSPHEDALPLVMTHGWPGSVVEFGKVIGPLTDPERTAGTGRRLPPGVPVAARIWVQRQAGPARLGRCAYRGRVGGADGAARLRAVRGAGRRLGIHGHHRAGHPASGAAGRDPPEHGHRVSGPCGARRRPD